MRYQPKNPNTARPNKHTLYLAASGGGKSQALMQNPALPKAGARIILWDQSGDHAGLHFQKKANFLRALDAGLRSGRGFRVAYAGPADPDTFDWFMEICWACLDGEKETYVIAEELSAVCKGSGKALPAAAVFMNQSRKYGGIFHGTSQKPQEVAKTFYDQCAFKFIGQQNGLAMQRKMSAEIGLQPEDIASLNKLEFFRHDGSANAPERIQLPYKKPSGVIWKD